ncbi:DUF5605 domain-containing protein [Microbacterium deminutum]|uniref:DUF5605 domain-containing protein n=1 Tax=Microbacterium deminutum TaxID=344164 RepID=A0ABN2Q5I5_9MICO
MSTFHSRSSLAGVLTQPHARAVVEEIAPEVLESALAQTEASFPLAPVLSMILDPGDKRVQVLLERLYALEDRTERSAEESPITPRLDYEATDIPLASAGFVPPENATANRLVELTFTGPSHGNPFVEVELTVRLALEDIVIDVGAFYDGDGRYIARYLPPQPGVWTFSTSSTARSLDGITGSIAVVASDAPGPVRADGFHFRYADGTPFTPLGTTAYAWTHQSVELQETTLRALSEAPFTKIRMALFPKHFIFNTNEPERFVFPRDGDGWDTTGFDLEYFRQLETRLTQLGELGVQADLILFHPYDRWGFANLGRAADDRYVQYVVRRLAAFPNVWWSLANEYDLLLDKNPDDWDRIAGVIRDNDHVGHPLSIHNWLEIWDYESEWATHCSIQHGEQLGARVREWRGRWRKPVIVDECGYEGDIDQGWGFLPATDEVRRIWDAVMAGGYATHGETYHREDDVLFWAKGGQLHGESPARIAFLRSIIEDSPTGRLEPLPSDFDAAHAGVDGQYLLIYFGGGQPAFRAVKVPAGMRARIDVIDTWNMTITTLPGEHVGEVRVDLPGRPYIAVRLRSVIQAESTSA